MLKQDYYIDVIGRQEYPERPGDIEEIKLSTTGTYEQKDGYELVTYQEYDEEDPKIVHLTELKIEPDRVTVTKLGSDTKLLLISGKKVQCVYDTGFGNTTLGVYTDGIFNQLSGVSGTLKIVYTLDMNASLISFNELEIRMRPNNS